MLVAPPAIVASAGRLLQGDPDEATFLEASEGSSRNLAHRRPYPKGTLTPPEVLKRQGLIRVSGVQGQVWGCQGLPRSVDGDRCPDTLPRGIGTMVGAGAAARQAFGRGSNPSRQRSGPSLPDHPK